MPVPRVTPIGLHLSSTAKVVARAFAPHTWQILLTLKTCAVANQREIAAAVGIAGTTLTHHLNATERDGLLTRRRDPGNRRVHIGS